MVGYDMPKRLLLARNSFGINWCMNGYCWIPFDYAQDNFMDMWTIDIELK
jgi:C1A family cysteine protease